MRLRSIPPLTMNTLLRRRAGLIMQERAAQVRQNLLAIRGNLERIETSHRGAIPHEDPPVRLSWGGGPRVLDGANRLGHGRKQSFASQAKPPRPVDLLIPSRPVPNREPTEHTTIGTADGCVIGITFPVPVGPDEVRWERQGDVLEVEYMGKAFTYYHAFMVPTDGEPNVEQEGRSLTFQFPTSA